LKERAEADAIYRRGQEIACLYMLRVNEGQFLNLELLIGQMLVDFDCSI
jgi:hypothetical protein